MKYTLFAILVLLYFALPLLFQLIAGIKAMRNKIKMKFWLVCLISILGQGALCAIIRTLLKWKMKNSEIHDGLPFVAIMMLTALFGGILLLVIIVQSIVFMRRKRSKELTTDL